MVADQRAAGDQRVLADDGLGADHDARTDHAAGAERGRARHVRRGVHDGRGCAGASVDQCARRLPPAATTARAPTGSPSAVTTGCPPTRIPPARDRGVHQAADLPPRVARPLGELDRQRTRAREIELTGGLSDSAEWPSAPMFLIRSVRTSP